MSAARTPQEAELFAGKRLCDERNAAELRLDEDTTLTHDVLLSLRAWGQRFLGQKLPPLRA